MSNTQNLAGRMASSPKTSYRDILSGRVLQQQAKESQQRDIEENLREGQEYGQKNAQQQDVARSYSKNRKDSGGDSSKSGGASKGPFGGISDFIKGGLETIFKNLGLTMAGVFALLFPKEVIDIVSGLMSGLKHLGIMVLKVVKAFAQGLDMLNEHGVSPSNLALGGLAIAGGTVVGKVTAAAGKALGAIADFGKKVFDKAASKSSKAGSSASRGKLLDRLKEFLASDVGKKQIAKVATKSGATLSASAILNAFPGAGSIIWTLIGFGVSLYTAYEIFEAFNDWDADGMSKEEIENEKSGAEKGRQLEEKEAKQKEETHKSLQAVIKDADKGIKALEATDPHAWGEKTKAAFDKVTQADKKGSGTTPPTPTATKTETSPNTTPPTPTATKTETSPNVSGYTAGEALKYKGTQGAKDIQDMIGKAETDTTGEAAYSAWNGGMPEDWIGQKLTDKSIQEIIDMQKKNTTKGSEAAGKYQFMPIVLKELTDKFKIDRSKKFSADMQDELMLIRTHHKRDQALNNLLEGKIGTDEFNKAIIPEWAAVPATTRQVYDLKDKQGNPYQNIVEPGRSYYHGSAHPKGTKAHDMNNARMAVAAQNVVLAKVWGSENNPSTALVPNIAATGQQMQENSDTLLGDLHGIFKKINEGFKTQSSPTIINTSQSSPVGKEPAEAHSIAYAAAAIRNYALHGNESYA